MSTNTTATRRFLAGDIVKFKDENDERYSDFADFNNIKTFMLVTNENGVGDVFPIRGATSCCCISRDDIELVTPTPDEARQYEIAQAIEQKKEEIEKLHEESINLVRKIKP